MPLASTPRLARTTPGVSMELVPEVSAAHPVVVPDPKKNCAEMMRASPVASTVVPFATTRPLLILGEPADCPPGVLWRICAQPFHTLMYGLHETVHVSTLPVCPPLPP